MFSANRGGIGIVASIAFAGFAVVTSSSARCEILRHPRPHHEPTHQPVRHETQIHPPRVSSARHVEMAHVVNPHAATAHEPAASNNLAHPLPRSAAAAPHPPAIAAPKAAVPVPARANPAGSAPAEPPSLVNHASAGAGQETPQRLFADHQWQQFGHAYAYRRLAAAALYPAAYYGWALTAWPHPIAYSWGWRSQPWYPAYGVLFVPYPVYSSPDLWMTDYILAQNMQAAYQGPPAPVPSPSVEPAPLMDSGAPSPDMPGTGNPEVSPPANLPLSSPSGAPPSSPASVAPPAITPAVKAQLDTQIKVQLRDQQAAAAMPATLTTASGPPALRANHVFFEVVQPLSVPMANDQDFCSLKPNDYIRRAGGMSPDDWMIPVVVVLSASADCPVGLHTRIGLNDLTAMENEQEAQVMQALQAASKSTLPNGPLSSPAVHSALTADRTAAPDVAGLGAIESAQ
jgi:hypothetical protein